ncbi:hypothetical protein ACO2RV_10380 [Ancylobacter sp. VNQ12]|uniref:hypothetical protein n=1 Tax=Ancylobacter sp. VNQ12 TaxID=3400920 RepID=UPI003BFDAB75
MDTHVRERDGLARSRRETLRLGLSTLVVGPPAVGLAYAAMPGPPLSPQERIEHAMRQIQDALADLYPGARQHPRLALPSREALASPVFEDGTFEAGDMAMVMVTANTFSARYDAGLKSRTDLTSFGNALRSGEKRP